jgi:hypothetical protein
MSRSSCVGSAGQGPEAQVEAELAVLVADEVQHGEAALSRALRSPRPSCWRNTVALSVGPQEQHRVDLGDVDALVEQIHGEQHLQLAGLQPQQRVRAARPAVWR